MEARRLASRSSADSISPATPVNWRSRFSGSRTLRSPSSRRPSRSSSRSVSAGSRAASSAMVAVLPAVPPSAPVVPASWGAAAWGAPSWVLWRRGPRRRGGRSPRGRSPGARSAAEAVAAEEESGAASGAGACACSPAGRSCPRSCPPARAARGRLRRGRLFCAAAPDSGEPSVDGGAETAAADWSAAVELCGVPIASPSLRKRPPHLSSRYRCNPSRSASRLNPARRRTRWEVRLSG